MCAAKVQNTPGTVDQIPWVALHVAERNGFPFFLVVDGSVLTDKDHLPVLQKTAASLNCVLGAGTLDYFTAQSDIGHRDTAAE